MATRLDWFEQVVRKVYTHTWPSGPLLLAAPVVAKPPTPPPIEHPFEVRNLHQGFPRKVRSLFDDGHGAEATFHAFKYVEKFVQRHSGNRESGRKLMMAVFDKDKSVFLKLNALSNESELDEQEGYRFMFTGAIIGIRNPGGHEIELSDDLDICLDHLAFASLLLRRLERSGFK